MKFIGLAICILVIIGLANAENGAYIPKAFYKINPNGVLSPIREINDVLLKRLRRSPQYSQSSSSSSSSSSVGGPGGTTFFTQQTAVHNNPGGLESRFGEPSGTGVFTQTSGHVDQYGQVHYNTQTGRL